MVPVVVLVVAVVPVWVKPEVEELTDVPVVTTNVDETYSLALLLLDITIE